MSYRIIETLMYMTNVILNKYFTVMISFTSNNLQLSLHLNNFLRQISYSAQPASVS